MPYNITTLHYNIIHTHTHTHTHRYLYKSVYQVILFICIYNITISNKMEQLFDCYFLFLYKIMKRYGMRKYIFYPLYTRWFTHRVKLLLILSSKKLAKRSNYLKKAFLT